jgi:DNA-binding MarR family transcriptional regulator
MADDSCDLLQCCLYFTANSLARAVTRLADEAFRRVGMSPSHAFVLMLVIDRPGISQQELAEHLRLAPSTVSRFVDTLVARGLVAKGRRGKTTVLDPTASGAGLREPIAAAWRGLYDAYSERLGQDTGDALTRETYAACEKLG